MIILVKKILKILGCFSFVKINYKKINMIFIKLRRKKYGNNAPCSFETKRCLDNIYSIKYKYDWFGENSPVCCNTHLYEIFRDVSKVLEINKLDYFINYGTLLGAVRHKGIIPWDTDVDIGIVSKDFDLIYSVVVKELSSKYHIVKEDDYLKVYFSEVNKIHLDFDIWHDKGTYLEFNGDIYCGTRVIKKDIIYPLKKYFFYDLEVYGPNSTEFLDIIYGRDYMDLGYKKWGVETEVVSLGVSEASAVIDKYLLRD